MTGASPKLDIVRTQALKEILALQIRQSMETEGLSKTAMARRMKTSRPAPYRVQPRCRLGAPSFGEAEVISLG